MGPIPQKERGKTEWGKYDNRTGRMGKGWGQNKIEEGDNGQNDLWYPGLLGFPMQRPGLIKM